MPQRNDYRLHGQYIDVSFAGEDLSNRVLSGTYVGVDFQDADLRGSSLIGTFIGSVFNRADLRGANTAQGRFIDSDLSQAKQLNGR